MEGLFGFLVIIGIVNTIIKWAKKQSANGQQNQGASPEKPWQRMIGDIAKTVEESMSGKTPAKNVPVSPAYKTLKEAAYREGMGGGEGVSGSAPAFQRPATISLGAAAGSSYQPGEGTSYPQEPIPQWHGSLGGTEGSLAFTANLKDVPAAEQTAETRPALNLSFTRDSLMQAVVMHEILTRPQDKRRRCGTR